MRSGTEPRGVAAALLLLLAACTPSPSPPPSGASPTPAGLGLADPGQPYDAADILDAMRSSPRPDGVPDAVQTDAAAAGIAAAIWTFDGEPWETIVIDAACGATCSVDVSGSRTGGGGEDLWTFEIDPGSGAVEVVSSSLRAVPAPIAAALDTLARRVATPSALDDLELTSVAWTPPPAADRFTLNYRSGGEEGSCGGELILDARAGTLIEESYAGC